MVDVTPQLAILQLERENFWLRSTEELQYWLEERFQLQASPEDIERCLKNLTNPYVLELEEDFFDGF